MLQKERTFLQSFLSIQWPGEVVEGNWVFWEKYIVAFWAKSGRAVRLSPVRAHRVRYSSWLRSQAADWLTCPQTSGSRVWSQEMWPPCRGGWRARSLPEILEHLLFRCLPAVPAGWAMGAVGRGPGSRAWIAGTRGGGALPAGPRPAPDGRAARAGEGRGPARGRAGPGCCGAGALGGTPALAPKVCRARAMRTLWMALCVLARLWPGALAGCADAGRCCPGRDPACFASGWRQDRVYGTCFCDQACRVTGDCCFDYARACPGGWRARGWAAGSSPAAEGRRSHTGDRNPGARLSGAVHQLYARVLQPLASRSTQLSLS